MILSCHVPGDAVLPWQRWALGRARSCWNGCPPEHHPVTALMLARFCQGFLPAGVAASVVAGPQSYPQGGYAQSFLRFFFLFAPRWASGINR
jgi:hypothetical protein